MFQGQDRARSSNPALSTWCLEADNGIGTNWIERDELNWLQSYMCSGYWHWRRLVQQRARDPEHAKKGRRPFHMMESSCQTAVNSPHQPHFTISLKAPSASVLFIRLTHDHPRRRRAVTILLSISTPSPKSTTTISPSTLPT